MTVHGDYTLTGLVRQRQHAQKQAQLRLYTVGVSPVPADMLVKVAILRRIMDSVGAAGQMRRAINGGLDASEAADAALAASVKAKADAAVEAGKRYATPPGVAPPIPPPAPTPQFRGAPPAPTSPRGGAVPGSVQQSKYDATRQRYGEIQAEQRRAPMDDPDDFKSKLPPTKAAPDPTPTPDPTPAPVVGPDMGGVAAPRSSFNWAYPAAGIGAGGTALVGGGLAGGMLGRNRAQEDAQPKKMLAFAGGAAGGYMLPGLTGGAMGAFKGASVADYLLKIGAKSWSVLGDLAAAGQKLPGMPGFDIRDFDRAILERTGRLPGVAQPGAVTRAMSAPPLASAAPPGTAALPRTRGDAESAAARLPLREVAAARAAARAPAGGGSVGGPAPSAPTAPAGGGTVGGPAPSPKPSYRFVGGATVDASGKRLSVEEVRAAANVPQAAPTAAAQTAAAPTAAAPKAVPDAAGSAQPATAGRGLMGPGLLAGGVGLGGGAAGLGGGYMVGKSVEQKAQEQEMLRSFGGGLAVGGVARPVMSLLGGR